MASKLLAAILVVFATTVTAAPAARDLAASSSTGEKLLICTFNLKTGQYICPGAPPSCTWDEVNKTWVCSNSPAAGDTVPICAFNQTSGQYVCPDTSPICTFDRKKGVYVCPDPSSTATDDAIGNSPNTLARSVTWDHGVCSLHLKLEQRCSTDSNNQWQETTFAYIPYIKDAGGVQILEPNHGDLTPLKPYTEAWSIYRDDFHLLVSWGANLKQVFFEVRTVLPNRQSIAGNWFSGGLGFPEGYAHCIWGDWTVGALDCPAAKRFDVRYSDMDCWFKC